MVSGRNVPLAERILRSLGDTLAEFTLTNRRAHENHGFFMRKNFQNATPLMALSAVAGLSLLILFLFDPAHYHFYPTCYFHLLTGLYCPGCGGLRAIHQLLHGNLAAAARLNLLVVVSLPAATLWRVRRIRPLWIWTFIVASAVFTVVRNIQSGDWLRP